MTLFEYAAARTAQERSREAQAAATRPYLDAAKARQLAEEGIDASDKAAAEAQKAIARAAIRRVAGRQEYLHSENIWDELQGTDIDPTRGSFLGALLRAAARDGVIELVPDRVAPSARPANHNRIMRVWRSLIYPGSP